MNCVFRTCGRRVTGRSRRLWQCPGPGHGVVGQRGVDAPPQELRLHGVDLMAELEQADGEPSGPATMVLERRDPSGDFTPGIVGPLELRRQPEQVPPGKRRELSPDSEYVLALPARHFEGHASGECPREGGVTSLTAAQSQ